MAYLRWRASGEGGAEGAVGAAGDAVPAEVALQLSAMQRALVAREQEAARLQEQLHSIRAGAAAAPLLPPPPGERAWAEGTEASLGRRPSQTEFEQARERHERELAKMRFEREMLEEKVRPEPALAPAPEPAP